MLRLIAVFKFVKALLLVVVGFGALKLIDPALMERAQAWAAMLASSYDRHIVQRVLATVLGQTPGKLEAIGIAAFLYAGLFTVEGTGLWLRARWAEYLTIIATISFVPFELYELTRRVSAPRVTALIVNLAVVAYLVIRLRRGEAPTKRSKR